jgi:hypothetical protein
MGPRCCTSNRDVRLLSLQDTVSRQLLIRRRETTYELFAIAGLGGRNFHSHMLLHEPFFGNQTRPLHMPEDLYSTTRELALVLATLIGQRYGPHGSDYRST